jgi:hypothetical protein
MNIKQLRKVVPQAEFRKYRVEGEDRVAGWVRPSRLRRSPDGRQRFTAWNDALSYDERQGGMSPNGGPEFCERFGAPGVFPFARRRRGRITRRWEIEGGAFRPSRYSDDPFSKLLLEEAREEFGELEVVMPCFSDAVVYGHRFLQLNPGLVDCLVAVNGTAPAIEEPAPPGSRVVVIHGTKKRGEGLGEGPGNLVLPFEGGVGSSLGAWVRTWPFDRPQRSKPYRQVLLYAGDYEPVEDPDDQDPPTFFRTRYGPRGVGSVQYLVVDGGHAWYGRQMGTVLTASGEAISAESPLSGINWGPGNPNFNVNEVIAFENNWDPVVA